MVSRISENAILGMPFLETHGCCMNFGEATLCLGNQDLGCDDRQRKKLRTHIQVADQRRIPPRSETLLVARMTIQNHGPIGIVKGGDFPLSVASCISKEGRLRCQGKKQKESYRALLADYSDVFEKPGGNTGRTSLVEHHINTPLGITPVRLPPYRLGAEKEAEADRQVEELQRQDKVEPGTGAWSSPVVLVKRQDRSWRFCADYQWLNTKIDREVYSLPPVSQGLNTLVGNRYFSTLHLAGGRGQIP